MCEHLLPLENEIRKQGAAETYRNQVWSKNCREWVYFDCFLDIEKLRERLSLPDFVIHHVNNDSKSGLEEGFVCTRCHDAVMGLHRSYPHPGNKPMIT